jgi:release factor glutamine methyltransferase
MSGWTIQQYLNRITEYLTEKHIDSPRLQAELLMSEALGMQRIDLYTQFDKEVSKENSKRLEELVHRAEEFEPIAYIIGRTEFYSIDLEITKDCLIPRPETELLVDKALEFLKGRKARQFVCDLCTGCGCIAIAIAKNFLDADIIATDISDAALKHAEKNIERHRLKERIRLLCGDLFEPFVPQIDRAKFDLIICNPPYVSSAEYEKLDKNVKDYEPRQALFGGEDGLDVYRRIALEAADYLKADAALIVETGYRQGEAVKKLFEQAGYFGEIKIEKDFQNNDRVVIARR